MLSRSSVPARLIAAVAAAPPLKPATGIAPEGTALARFPDVALSRVWLRSCVATLFAPIAFSAAMRTSIGGCVAKSVFKLVAKKKWLSSLAAGDATRDE